MAIQGFFTGDVKIRDLNGVLKAVDGIVEVATDAGTVTSVGLSVGSTGTDVNVADSPITSSGNITLNLPTASATNRGLLSSADWASFDSKQGTITLTTTGSSGPATLIAGTLNIPNYSGALTGYVPYTGATQNVDLGEYGLKSGYIGFDLTPTNTPATQGTMYWNADKESLDLIMNGVTGSLMQDSFFNVKNQTGSSIPKGTIVRAAGTVGASGRILIAPFLADGTYDSKFCIGITAETIADGEDGKVTAFGAIRQIDTSAFPNGTVLYASPTTAGGFTSTEPSNPNNIVTVAIVVYSDNNNGEIFVRPTFIPSQADLIKSLGFTPVTNARTLTINGTTYDLSANRTWSVGTVTSIATTGPLTGGTITGSGTIGITQASTSTDGYLSSTDWNTFNSKQAALTFSAPLINTSGTISIPAATSSVNGYLSSADWDTFNNKQAALSGTGFVKISGTTISYDNSTYYLASNPNSYISLTALSATAPLSYSNTTGVFSISQATTSTDGYLSSTDWNTFNNKQAAGNYITALTGEATASGPGSASVTLSTSAVTGKLLTGLNLTGGGTIAATDSILQAFGKVQNQISGLAGGVTYQGTWNASTNTPTLTSSVGTKGYYYIVDVAGSTNLNGITDWKIGDWAIFNGSTWDKVDNTDAVSSVNGFTGAVSLTTSNIAEGTNLYYLDSRARLALSFTAGSGAYDNTTGVITIPTNTSQLTNGANFITLSSLSASSPLAYNSGSGAFSIQVATSSQNGYLSSTDWTTFNSKQPAGNYVTTDTTQTITALKTFTAKVVINTGGTDDQLQLVGTAPSIRLTNAVTGATINGFIAMSGGANNYIQGSVSGDMTIGNQNNGKILFGFGSGTATQKMSLDSSGNAVLSGGLTLGSTLSNGTYTYTLPGATGTLALVGGAGVGTVTSIATTGPITGGTITSTGTIGITQSGAASDGYLSSTDWNTFNNKQSALTNPVTGTGTTNYLPKFTGASTIGNSQVFDDSGKIGIGTATPDASFKLTISGNSAAVSPGIYFNDEASSPTNYALYTNGSKNFVLRNQSTSNNIAVFTPSGNLGLGVTPSAWSLAGLNVMQIKNGFIYGYSNETSYGVNAYYNGSNWTYIASAEATRYGQNTGIHAWYTAPSGTAGNAISFTQAMTLNASGNLSIGNTNDTYKLDVTGSARFNGSGSNGYLYVFGNAGAGGSTNPAYLQGMNFSWNKSNGGGESLLTYTNAGGGSNIRFGIGYWNNSTYSEQFSIASTGAATFSSSIDATVLNSTRTSGYLLRENSGSGYGIYKNSTTEIGIAVNGNVALNFASSGAATFSSSVTATELYLSTSNGLVGNINSSNANGGYLTWQTSGAVIADIGTAQQIFGSGGNDTFGINGRGARAIAFGTNNTERVRITSGGNALFGTTTDGGYRVDVSGQIRSYASSALIVAMSSDAANDAIIAARWTSGTGIEMRYNPNSAISYIQSTYPATGGQQFGDIHFRINSAGTMTTVMTVKANNTSVGIGTTSPANRLHVTNTGGSLSTLTDIIGRFNATTNTAGQGSAIALTAIATKETGVILGAEHTSGSNGDFVVRIYNGGADYPERMRITSGGNVEINTGSIKTGEPDTGWGRAAIKIGARATGEAFDSGGYLPVNVDGTVYYINLYSSTP